jgi:pilus assembly protein Flp/PilA
VSNFVQRFFKDESGATAIEYGLIAALVAVIIVGGITAVGTKLSSTFDTVQKSLP